MSRVRLSRCCKPDALDFTFPEYEIVNMGAFDYANAKPQLNLREYGAVFTPLEKYLTAKDSMPPPIC